MTYRLAFVLLCATGCSSVDSDNILTSGIHAELAATASGDGRTDTIATLYLGNPINLDFIDVTGDDQLFAWNADDRQPMSEFELLGLVTYSASFDGDDEDETFHIGFERAVDDGAPDSWCDLPAPFELVTEAPLSASRGEELVIEWEPAGTADAMRWEAQGDCIDSTGDSLDDDEGVAIIEADTLTKEVGDTVPDSCTVTVRIWRSRDGDLDPGYGEGGSIRAHQVRSMTFESTP